MSLENKRAIVYLTPGGLALANRLAALFPEARQEKFSRKLIPELWRESAALIFIMATGIVVRTIAPLIKNKRTDPAVVVIDEKGMFAVSLLGGHLGGANKIAADIAAFLQGKAVITTASDIHNLTPLDIWARDNGLAIEDWGLVPKISGRLVKQGSLQVYTEVALDLPADLVMTANPGEADLLVTHKKSLFDGGGIDREPGGAPLYLRPHNLVVGIGCNSNTKAEEIEAALIATLDRYNLSFFSVAALATVDRKATEPGILALAAKYGLPIQAFSTAELNAVERVTRSEAAIRALGVQGVAEPAALLAAGAVELLVAKQKIGNVTVALARKKYPLGNRAQEGARPNLYVVGTGPGSLDHITPHAREAIARSEVIVGYGVYVDLIAPLIAGKEIVSTGMTQEVERCQKAVELALTGKTVCVVSGGDPGIYAMAGLVLEILRDRGIPASLQDSEAEKSEAPSIRVEIIPGISALSAGAARLGAPLMHDFAVVSLSDRLTPWELIEKRLAAAAQADFVIVIFNPKSRGRPRQINRAREILLQHRPAETPVGVVRGAFRENEQVITTSLEDMLNHPIDMQTTIFIGNSQTLVCDGRMITPRGYRGDR